MSYGGLTKGLTALGSALILAATREQVGEALHGELATSQPALLNYLTRSVPDMFPKAYRWVGEMEEVADFVGEGAEQEIYAAIAGLYARLAADFSDGRQDIDSLARFFSHPPAEKGS
jgi:hypothetical protein